jgi:hypothetical protein
LPEWFVAVRLENGYAAFKKGKRTLQEVLNYIKGKLIFEPQITFER